MTTDNLLSLGVYLMNGNRPFVGQEIIVELKFNKLVKGKIVDFKENLTEYTRMTMCRVCENTATVELSTGEILENFPFSMIYLQNKK